MVSHMSLESYSSRFSFIHSSYSPCGEKQGENKILGRLIWLGDQPHCAQYIDLYRVILLGNLTISMVVGSSPPSILNLNFQRNLSHS